MGILPFTGSSKRRNDSGRTYPGGRNAYDEKHRGGLAKLFGGGGGQTMAGMGRLIPGRELDHVSLHTVQGGRIELGASTGRWQLIVVYRGKHCPVSRNYLASLQMIIGDLDELGVEVTAVSGDGRERAQAFLDSLRATTETKDISFKIAYGLTVEQMFRWGLYVSEPRSPREADGPFPEPAIILLNPEGFVTIVDYSNSPFARPDLRILVEGVRYIQENDYPTRGTHGLMAYPPAEKAYAY